MGYDLFSLGRVGKRAPGLWRALRGISGVCPSPEQHWTSRQRTAPRRSSPAPCSQPSPRRCCSRPAPPRLRGAFRFAVRANARTPPSASAYADPNSNWSPFGWRAPEAPRPEIGGGSVAYCVRLCDGRFFPIQRHGGATPAQACSSFCPATQTKIYNGSSIDHAVGPDGKRYARARAPPSPIASKIVPGCTCNGKDAFGLVNTPVEEDPTLRPGDIVGDQDRPDGLQRRRAGDRASRRSDPIRASRRTCGASSPKPRSRRRRKPPRRPRPGQAGRQPGDRPHRARTSGFRPTGSRRPPPRARARR